MYIIIYIYIYSVVKIYFVQTPFHTYCKLDHIILIQYLFSFLFSSTTKSRLKIVSSLHITLWLLLLFRMASPLCVLLGIRPPSVLQQLKLPRAELWEYAWLFSIIPSILSFISIKRNKCFLMQQYLLGTLLLGILPVGFAIITLVDDLIAYWDTRASSRMFLGFPVVVLWNMFLAICLQVHIFGLYFGCKLYNAWKPKVKKT